MAEPRIRLIELAEAVVDGSDVDWQRATDGAEPAERDTVRSLSLLATLGRVHTIDVPLHPETDATSPDTGDGSGPAAVSPEEPAFRWGGLDVFDVIGHGAFGEVRRARDRNLQRDVALKLLHADPPDDRRVLDEGRRLARLDHPAVVRVFGAETHDGRVGMWMELVTGRTLRDIVTEDGPRGEHEAALIGAEIARALAAVHQAGVLHRDVKADNVLRAEGGRLVLVDFGSGVDTASAGDEERLRGTPLYLAPELMEGGHPSPQSDLYALGVLLYYLVTGCHPVDVAGLSGLRAAYRARTTIPLVDRRQDLSAEFIALVERALAHEPDDRPASAGEMVGDLSRLSGAVDTPDSPATSTSRAADDAGTTRRRARLVPGLLVGLGLLIAVFLLWPPFAGWFGASATTWTVAAALHRVRDGVSVPIEPGGEVRPGDGIGLSFRVSAPVHLYVVNFDEVGKGYLLFPLNGHLPQNPIPPGESHSLPGTRNGRSSLWQVTSAGGEERLTLIGSPEPLPELEAIAIALAPAIPGRPVLYPELGPGGLERLRGIGGVMDAPATMSGDASSILGATRPLIRGEEEIDGVWMREIVLSNPR